MQLLSTFSAISFMIQPLSIANPACRTEKSGEGHPHAPVRCVVSFANQPGGGVILFGIDEKNGYVISGVYDAQDVQNNALEEWFSFHNYSDQPVQPFH